jgi:hypothetical protein
MLPLAVSWQASGHSARGFYHPEEERLVVCRRRGRPFSSYVDAGCVQIDLDDAGHFLGLAVEAPRERWPVEADLWAPRVAIPATVRFQQHPVTLESANLATDPDRRWLRIDLGDAEGSHVIEPCENVYFEMNDSRLCRIWVLHIQEDHDFRELRAWRGKAG